jgi:CRISPR-associated protein Csm1
MNDEVKGTLTPEERERWLAALAGLLHDVGKLAQRAGVGSGSHTKRGAEFVTHYVPEAWRDQLYAVEGHHDRPLHGHRNRVVALADRLSAAEREEAGEAAERQLRTILGRVSMDEGPRAVEQVWPLAPLALEEDALFPRDPVDAGAETAAYQALWDGFAAAVAGLPGGDLPAYVTGLFHALRRFTWCVPGAYYRSTPDVSLYDHSRTTAALAACLIDLDEDRIEALLAQIRTPPDADGPADEAPLVLLVGGDVSGVQDFIYTITARGAAKGLRGRSFYLEALTEAVARYVLRRLELPITNLIYAGGGHFYLLAPGGAEGDLEAIRAEISRTLLEHHGGALYLALGWTPVTASGFDREAFGAHWLQTSQAMNAAKRRRFSELDAGTLHAQVFGPTGTGGEEDGECQVCHREGHVRTERPGTDDERRICDLCASLEALGTDLRDGDYLLLGEVDPEETARGGYQDALRAFGTAVGFVTGDGRTVLGLPDDTRRASLLAMHDLAGARASDPVAAAQRIAAGIAKAGGYPVAAGTRYTVNVTPRVTAADLDHPYVRDLDPDERPKPGDVKEFGLMQAQAQGVKRLGVLRMDVDDLGDVFKWGMQETGTLSRVASLSFALSLFFEGWVGACCRAVNAEGPDTVYAIYSGGDDLFLVGAWDVLPGLADAIRSDLVRYAAGNPAVHLSGGLTLHGGKYPLYQAAADAEAALDTAKDYERDDPDHHKDAFNVLGVTVPWENYDALKQEQETLTELVNTGANRALLRTLITLYEGYLASVEEHGKPYWGPLMWQAAYKLQRMADRDKDHRDAIERIREALAYETFNTSIEILGPAARWADLLIRKE